MSSASLSSKLHSLRKSGDLCADCKKFAASPLHIVYDAPAIEVPVEADRDEAGLARHETRSLGHQGQGFGLLAVFRFHDRNLRHDLIIGFYLWLPGARARSRTPRRAIYGRHGVPAPERGPTTPARAYRARRRHGKSRPFPPRSHHPSRCVHRRLAQPDPSSRFVHR